MWGVFWLSAERSIPDETALPDSSLEMVAEDVSPEPDEIVAEPEKTANTINEEAFEKNTQEHGPVVFEEAVISGSEPRETAQLRESGHKALREDQLSIAEKNNTNYYYLKVLEFDSGNHEAKRGRLQAANGYHTLAQSSFKNGDSRKVRRYIGRELMVQPSHPSLVKLMKEVNSQETGQ